MGRILAAAVRVVHQPGTGRRLVIAMRSAARVSSCGMARDMAQPTTLRENKSSTTARYSQPSSVGT